MLLETWNQVAGWGIETIKNIQTHVGLGDEDGSNDECVPAPLPTVAPAPLPTVARHSIETEHKEAATAASVRVDKGGISSHELAALKAEHDVLAKARRAFRVQFEKLRGDLVVARAKRGKVVISLGAENDENEPVIAAIMAKLHNLNLRNEEQGERLAFLEDKIASSKNSSFIDIDTSHFTHHTEGASKQTSPVSSRRGSESASPVRGSSPVRHTSDTAGVRGGRPSNAGSSMLASPAASHRDSGSSSPVRHTWDKPHTHFVRRLSTEGCSSMLASQTASTPQGGDPKAVKC
ncbi:hypothetical protein T484DRAFT_1949143 [Baffinella frigidus]|nr:hypothetical protein T484DRAFT_1949143 [Cryptophyta sp. CCMP2293]|mmetsp:Transcript_55801/g.132441  ORF Transcript_55801/g.132441 Transcript_55801/m.132441 type:complete len:292 (-) Transcript_55801:3-878(-)